MIYKLILHTIPEEHRKALLEYCERAQNQDETFKFTFDDKYVVIDCPTMDVAYKRGILLHSRFNVFFEVERNKQ